METTRALKKAITVLEVRAAEYFGRIEEAEATYAKAESQGCELPRTMVALAENITHTRNEYESCMVAKRTLENLLSTISN